jgi:hypothetical protein
MQHEELSCTNEKNGIATSKIRSPLLYPIELQAHFKIKRVTRVEFPAFFHFFRQKQKEAM